MVNEGGWILIAKSYTPLDRGHRAVRLYDPSISTPDDNGPPAAAARATPFAGATRGAGSSGGRILFASRQAVGTKADAVYDELREQLISGRRRYGETLSTAELAAEFGVSRRPVMDAMMRLELAGLIEIIRQVGCRVVVPDRESVREHFYTAAVLEGAAARLAAVNLTAGVQSELEAALRESRSASKARDVVGFGVANKRLHAAILTAAGNQRLSDLAHSAWDLSDFYLLDRRPEDLVRSHREHEQIVASIFSGDAEAARELMEQHMVHFGELPATAESGAKS